MGKISIREAQEVDAELIFEMILELAEYEKAREQVKTSTTEIRESLFGLNTRAHALISYLDAEVAGYAVYFFNYSTWTGKYGVYLEDVYVKPACRGQGVGKSLLKNLARIAVDKDCARFEWAVLDWNTPAISFYESLGARRRDDWELFRIDGDELRSLAND